MTIFEKTRAFVPQCGEDYIVAMLALKCKGEPLKRVMEAGIRTINEFKEFLNLHFRTVKNLSAWLREFSDFTQKATERVMDFNYRIGKHLQSTISEIELQGGPNRNARIIIANETAIRSFIGGVFAKYAQVLIITEFATLQDAVTAVMAIETRFNDMPNLKATIQPTKDSFFSESNTKSQTIANKHNSASKNAKLCDYCKKPGHFKDKCYKHINDEKSKQGNPKINSNDQVQCNYCKKTGHLTRDCRKRAFNNGRRSTTNNTQQQSGNGQGPSGSRTPPGTTQS